MDDALFVRQGAVSTFDTAGTVVRSLHAPKPTSKVGRRVPGPLPGSLPHPMVWTSETGLVTYVPASSPERLEKTIGMLSAPRAVDPRGFLRRSRAALKRLDAATLQQSSPAQTSSAPTAQKVLPPVRQQPPRRKFTTASDDREDEVRLELRGGRGRRSCVAACVWLPRRSPWPKQNESRLLPSHVRVPTYRRCACPGNAGHCRLRPLRSAGVCGVYAAGARHGDVVAGLHLGRPHRLRHARGARVAAPDGPVHDTHPPDAVRQCWGGGGGAVLAAHSPAARTQHVMAARHSSAFRCALYITSS